MYLLELFEFLLVLSSIVYGDPSMLFDLGLQRLPDLRLPRGPILHPLFKPLKVTGQPIKLMHNLVLVAGLGISDQMGKDMPFV